MYTWTIVCALVLPMCLLLGVVEIYPFVRSIISTTGNGAVNSLSLRDVATDDVFWLYLIRTIKTALVVAGICLVLGYPTAELINRTSGGVRIGLLALVVVPLWSSDVARSYSWVGILGTGGLADRVANFFGRGPLNALYTEPAVVIGMCQVLLPIFLIPCYLAILRYDTKLDRAARSLGASPLRSYVSIKLPILITHLFVAWAAVFVIALGFYITPAMLGGPSSQMVSNLIASEALFRYDTRGAEAMGLMLLAVTIAIIGALASIVYLARRWLVR